MNNVIVVIIAVIICVLVWELFSLAVALVVWLCRGSRRCKTIEENHTSKAVLTKSATYMATNESVSLSRECTSVSSEQNDEQKGSDEVACCKNKEQTVENDIRGNCENLEFDKFRSSVQLQKLQEKMTKMGHVHGLNQHIRDSSDAWDKLELNVAVTGNTGVGKSSLINALRRVKPSDENAAKVDVVETTTQGQKYTYPENKHVALWDLPGIGTQKFTRQKYLEKMDFSRFDVAIIVSAGRFLEDDIWLGKELLALQKNILFVRTKIDFDMKNAKRDHPNDFKEVTCLAKIRDNLTENIRIGGIPDSVSGIYLVSSPKSNLYDFAELDEKLKSLLSIKGKAITTLLQKAVEKAIRADQEFNKTDFKGRKVSAVVCGFLPIPYLESAMGNMSLSSIRELCLKRFCIDDSSLDKISHELRLSKDFLKQSLKSHRVFDAGTLLDEGRILTPSERTNRLLGKLGKNKIFHNLFRKYSKYIVPVSGMFLSANLAYSSLEKCLTTMCDEMAEDALKLVKLRLYRLETQLQPLKRTQ